MQSILKGREREAFDNFPEHIDPDDLIRYFLISEPLTRFLSKLRQGEDCLDLALRWCWLEYLGWQPDQFDKAPRAATKYVARQLDRGNRAIAAIADRTIRKRNAVIRKAAGWRDFGSDEMDTLRDELLRDSSIQANKRVMFARAIAWCRNAKVIHPGITVMERFIATVMADADASFNHEVVIAVNKAQRRKLIATIEKLIANAPARRRGVDLQQLKSPPGAPSERNLNRLLDNIAFMQGLGIGQIDLSHLPAPRRQTFVKDATRMSPADLRDLNKPRRVAMVICLLVDLWASHHNYAPQMHRRILQDSRTRAEGKRRKTVLPRLGNIFRYLRLLAEVFRIVRNKVLSDREKITQITALTASPGEMDAIIQDCDDIAKPEADSQLKHLSNKYSYSPYAAKFKGFSF